MAVSIDKPVERGTLYVVATPIGNLADLSARAQAVLGAVDLILAEDTRHSRRLLAHFGIRTPLLAYHDHNERLLCAELALRLASGESMALISDSGTPLLCDPGFHLLEAVHGAGLRAISIPGPSALVAALAVSGLPVERFAFEGFLPQRREARRKRLQALCREARTLVFYEAPHRVGETLEDLSSLFGPERPAAIAREITKLHEETRCATLADLTAWLGERPEREQGEFVIVVAPAEAPDGDEESDRRLLTILSGYLSPSQAAAAASAISGHGRNGLYRLALAMGEAQASDGSPSATP
ncbi:MAG: 16S rRNA (cytidine(1402)-2'-O)-methyltransferase [Gammaproteobacteria bacterium]